MPKYDLNQIEEYKFKKQFFYHYKLEKGTDLEPFQMAVVLDNISDFHCSLIIRADTEVELWQNIGPGLKIVWPRGEVIPDEKEDQIVAWKDFVNKSQGSLRKITQL
jgi:hypothetical protein